VRKTYTSHELQLLSNWENDLRTSSSCSRTGRTISSGWSCVAGTVRSGVIGSVGEYAWGGAASTIFWIDPAEDLIAIFLTQLMPSQTFNFRGQLQSILYSAILD